MSMMAKRPKPVILLKTNVQNCKNSIPKPTISLKQQVVTDNTKKWISRDIATVERMDFYRQSESSGTTLKCRQRDVGFVAKSGRADGQDLTHVLLEKVKQGNGSAGTSLETSTTVITPLLELLFLNQ